MEEKIWTVHITKENKKVRTTKVMEEKFYKTWGVTSLKSDVSNSVPGSN